MSEQEIANGNVNIEGDQNIVGDHNVSIKIDQIEVAIDELVSEKEKTFFFVPELKPYHSPPFISPSFIPRIVSQVQDRRFIIIGGDSTIGNKNDLARHCAWHLQTQAANGTHGHQDSLPVKEWLGEPSLQDLSIALQNEPKSTVFILPGLEPKHIRYEPFKIQELAKDNQHYVITASEDSIESWKLFPEEEKQFWWEIRRKDFETNYFTDHLRRRLKEYQDKLPDTFKNQDWDQNDYLVNDLRLDWIASQLETPINFLSFVDQICRNQVSDSENIKRLISQVQDQDHQANLRSWYYHQLDSRLQLLAISLTIFNGLFDDQIFGAIDGLIESTWRKRDPQLVSFDYQDLDKMYQFFNRVEDETGRIKIETSSLNRLNLLQLVWKTHRRYVLVSLPYLSSLLSNSIISRADNSELFGTELKQRQIHLAIADTLTDIGLISIDSIENTSIENTLLTLAANGHPTVQAIAADAMARWRHKGKDKEFFHTLRRWQKYPQPQEFVAGIIQERKLNNYAASAYIRATIAMAIASAAVYDRPNQMTEELVDWFTSFSNDNNPMVRHRFLVYTLRIVVQLHWKQLETELKQMTLKENIIPSLGVSLALAHHWDSTGINQLLESWQTEAQEMPVHTDEETINQREGLLATTALTYGYLPYYSGIDTQTIRKCVNKLKAILSNRNEHVFVQRAVWLALEHLTKRHFENLQPHLMGLIAYSRNGDKEDMVNLLTNVYLLQRKNLEDGEETFRLDNVTYQIWLEAERPKTTVEKMLFDWIDQTENPLAQRMAFQAFVRFAQVFDQYESQEIDRRRSKQKGTDLNHADDHRLPITEALWQIIIASWWVTRRQSEKLKAIIRNILPEALVQYSKERGLFKFVIDKWQNEKENAIVPDIANRLDRAVSIVINNIIVVTLLGIFFAVVIFACAFIIASLL